MAFNLRYVDILFSHERRGLAIRIRNPSADMGGKSADLNLIPEVKRHIRWRYKMTFKAMTHTSLLRRALMAVPLALLLAGGAAFAQQVDGIIYGKVVDDQGLAVPGATVTISSPQNIATEVRTTTDQGTYRVRLLKPSKNYTVVVELAGFRTMTFRQVELAAGQQIEVNATLSPGGVEETVTVTGETPLIDIKSSQTMITLDTNIVDNIPLRRSASALIESMPGVQDESMGGTSVHGGGPREHYFTLDGSSAMDTTNNVFVADLPVDMIEEVQITTGGIPAEFGQAVSGVFNFVTKSGGNDFSGAVNYYYRGEELESSNLTPELEEELGAKASTIKDQEYGGILGGPIKQDSVWFFGNIRRLSRDTLQPVLPSQPVVRSETQGFFKATGQAGGSLLSGSWYSKRSNTFPSGVRGFQNNMAPETWKEFSSTTDLFNAKWTHLVNEDTIFEAQYNQIWKSSTDTHPNNPNFTVGYRDQGTQLEFGGLVEGVRKSTCRCTWGYRFNLSHFREMAGGSHEFKVGFFNDHPNSDRSFIYPGGEDVLQQLLFGEAYRVVLENLPLTSQARSITTYAVFAQDQWSIGDRLTLNLGLRWEISEGWIPEQSRGGGRWFPVSTFPETHDLLNFSNVSPRLGLVYALGEERRTSIKVSYGRFYKSMATQDLSVAVPDIGGGETYEWNDLNGDLVFQDGEQGTRIGSVLNPGFSDIGDIIDPNVTNSWIDSFYVKLEHELTKDFVVSVAGIFKRERGLFDTIRRRTTGDQQNPFNDYRPIDVINQIDGSPLTIFALKPEFRGAQTVIHLTNPTFAGELFRDYNVLELVAQKRFRDGWQFLASYNYSDTYGNIGNNFVGTTLQNFVYNNPNTFTNGEGPLDQDAPHQIKLQGTYTLPYDILVSGFYQGSTGIPIHIFEPLMADLAPGAYTVRHFPLCPAGSAPPKGHSGGGGGCRPAPLGNPNIVVETNIDVAGEPRGLRRFDFRHNLDLRVEKQIPFGDGMKIGLILDVFNVTNTSRVTSYRSLKFDIPQFLQVSSIETPRILRIGLRFQF